MEFNSSLSSEYEKGIRRTLPSYDAMLRLIQSFFHSTLKNKASLLIIGAGSGNEIVQLAQNKPDWTFTGIDPSQAMLQVAKEKTVTLPNTIQYLEGTILNTNLPLDTYDAASCILVLHFIPTYEEKLATLSRIAEQLKPNAPFIIVSKYGQQGTVETEQQFALWRAYWLHNTKLTAEQINDMENSIRKLSFMREEEILTLLEAAGFKSCSRFFATTLFAGWICYKQ